MYKNVAKKTQAFQVDLNHLLMMVMINDNQGERPYHNWTFEMWVTCSLLLEPKIDTYSYAQ